jgi:methylmalonyl-CoA mutase N-terminal domain/subunit
VDEALARVQADARSGANLMPAIMEAVKAYASVGEITGVLVGVFGRYREPVRF